MSFLLFTKNWATNEYFFYSFQALLHFSKYCEPVVSGDAEMTDSRKLWRNIEPHLKKALHTVYLREVSSHQWESIISQDTQDNNENLGDQGKNIMSELHSSVHCWFAYKTNGFFSFLKNVLFAVTISFV